MTTPHHIFLFLVTTVFSSLISGCASNIAIDSNRHQNYSFTDAKSLFIYTDVGISPDLKHMDLYTAGVYANRPAFDRELKLSITSALEKSHVKSTYFSERVQFDVSEAFNRADKDRSSHLLTIQRSQQCQFITALYDVKSEEAIYKGKFTLPQYGCAKPSKAPKLSEAILNDLQLGQ